MRTTDAARHTENASRRLSPLIISLSVNMYLAEQAVGVDLQELSAGVGVPQTDAELVRQSFAQRSFAGAGRAVKQDHPARWKKK